MDRHFATEKSDGCVVFRGFVNENHRDGYSPRTWFRGTPSDNEGGLENSGIEKKYLVIQIPQEAITETISLRAGARNMSLKGGGRSSAVLKQHISGNIDTANLGEALRKEGAENVREVRMRLFHGKQMEGNKSSSRIIGYLDAWFTDGETPEKSE